VQGLFISDDPTLLDAIGIGLFVNLIPPWIGSLAAAGAGAFLYWRAQRVGSFGRLVLEMGGLGAVAALAVTEGLLPIAWQLPRLRIGVFSILAGGGLSMLGTWLLKPLYWGRKRAPSPASQSNHA